MKLDGGTALVTGANRGIGRALVQALAGSSLQTILAGVRDPERFEPSRTSGSGPAVRPVRLDLSSKETIARSCAELQGDLAHLRLLVNNAGLMTGGLLEEQDLDAIYAMFQVNLVAVVHLTREVLPGMLRAGSGMVVNNASISGYAHMPAASTYAASKAGIVAFTESLRRELRGTGVQAMHLVTPGVETEMLDATDEVYGAHMDTSGWDRVPPERWAAKVLAAIEADKRVLEPGGRSEAARLAAAGPAFVLDAIAARMFTRRRR